MGKGRGGNGWAHLALHRITVITLQPAWDFVAVQIRTKVRKEQQRLSLVHSGKSLQQLTDKVGEWVCIGTTGVGQENEGKTERTHQGRLEYLWALGTLFAR
jgi:hypothetical protein